MPAHLGPASFTMAILLLTGGVAIAQSQPGLLAPPEGWRDDAHAPRLSGTTVAGQVRLATFAQDEGAVSRMVQEGDRISRFTVLSISPGQVVLAGAGQEQVVCTIQGIREFSPQPASSTPETRQAPPRTRREQELTGSADRRSQRYLAVGDSPSAR